jgi:soluble lytic murein transglycosylase-like protein
MRKVNLIMIMLIIILMLVDSAYVVYYRMKYRAIQPDTEILASRIACILHATGVNSSKERDKLVKAIINAKRVTGVDETLLIALMYTESRYNHRAISSKKYKGLMQTPAATFVYYDVDVLLGAKILAEKIKITNGNLLEALAMYKGGRSKLAYRQAQEVLDMKKQIDSIF